MESTLRSDKKGAGIWGEGDIFHMARFWVPCTRKMAPTPRRSATRAQSLSWCRCAKNPMTASGVGWRGEGGGGRGSPEDVLPAAWQRGGADVAHTCRGSYAHARLERRAPWPPLPCCSSRTTSSFVWP